MSWVKSDMKRIGIWIAGLAVCLGLSTRSISRGADAGAAVTYKELSPSATLMKNKLAPQQAFVSVRKILEGSTPLTGNESSLNNYYGAYLFPLWTLTGEQYLVTLPKERERFIRNHLEFSAKNERAHEYLVDYSFNQLKPIVEDKEFHPAVRYHALMIIGMLNTTEPNRGSGVTQYPVPYASALRLLIDEFKKPDNNDAVRVAALLGLMRHLEWNNYPPESPRIQPAVKTEILDALWALVEMKTPPPGRSAEGHTWLRRRALEALAFTGLAPAVVDKKLADFLDNTISEDTEPVSLRCTAAEVMSRMNYKPPAVLQPSPAARKLGYLALFACNAELTRLDNLKKKDEQLAKMSGGFSGGGAVPGGPGAGVPGAGMPGGAGAGMPGAGGIPGGPPGAGGMMPGGGGMMPGRGARGGEGAGGMPGGGGMVPGMGSFKGADPKAYRIEYSRRLLRSQLYSVQLALGPKKKAPRRPVGAETKAPEPVEPQAGLRGVTAYAKTPADDTYVSSVITQLEDIIRILEATNQDAETYEKDLRKQMKKLEAITKPLAAPAKPEAPAEEVPMAAGAAAGKAPPAGEEVPMAESPAKPTAPAEAGKGAPPAEAGKGAPAPEAKGGAPAPTR